MIDARSAPRDKREWDVVACLREIYVKEYAHRRDTTFDPVLRFQYMLRAKIFSIPVADLWDVELGFRAHCKQVLRKLRRREYPLDLTWRDNED